MPSLQSLTLTTLLALALASPIFAQTPATTQPAYTLKVQTGIVLTNVVVRDKKSGAVVPNLKPTDFTVLENGKPQRIVSFDYQNVNAAAVLAEQAGTTSGKSVADLLNRNFAANPASLRDHRLIVLFFDLSTMQPEDVDRAVEAATTYINTQMQTADLVASVSMSTGLTLDQDFTASKSALLRAVGRYNGTQGTGFSNGGTGTTEGTADDASTFSADDSEYNSLNTDRELLAIQTIARSLERVDQRKSLLYFSGGLTRNGIENQSSMRSATNAAVRANMSIYAVDTRGLEALPPVGNASRGSLRGVSAYNGASMQNQLNANFGSQEVLSTLSTDTGGKFFSDSNSFTPAFQAIQRDTEAYYILGFRSSNPARDGSFRRLTVKLNRPGARLEYRPGYFAPADFQHQRSEVREQALTEQLRSDFPATDISVYLQALYFRMDENRFFVPVSLIVPGSEIPLLKNGGHNKASLDILGEVKNAQGIVVGNIRDTVKLALDDTQQVQRKNIQYSTSFNLAPGRYHLKFVLRENQTGRLGSFETDLLVPDLRKSSPKLSSVVLSSQRSPNPAKDPVSPLVRDGLEWIPNVPHVFRPDQHLFFLFELYDPTRDKSPEPAKAPGVTRRPSGAIHVVTSIEFLTAGAKVLETPLVEATQVNVPGRNAVAFQFDVPLASLKPGAYICQVNIIDDAGGSFSFPRLALQITAAAPSAQAELAAPASVGATSARPE